MLRTILAIIRVAFIDIFAYRSALAFWVLHDTIVPVAMILVWFAVYQGQSTVAGFTQAQMLLYYLGILIVTTTVAIHEEWEIRDDIRSGALRKYLTKPLPHPISILVGAFVWRAYASALSVPLAFALVAILNATINLEAPYPISWRFLLALLGSLGVFASMALFLGYLSFFLERSAGLIHANTVFRYLASGAILPLSLFPLWAQNIFQALPYAYMYDFPINVLVSNLPDERFLGGIALQWAWTLGFSVLATILWQVGLRRYDAPEQVGYGET